MLKPCLCDWHVLAKRKCGFLVHPQTPLKTPTQTLKYSNHNVNKYTCGVFEIERHDYPIEQFTFGNKYGFVHIFWHHLNLLLESTLKVLIWEKIWMTKLMKPIIH
jgi:hypothetical protein